MAGRKEDAERVFLCGHFLLWEDAAAHRLPQRKALLSRSFGAAPQQPLSISLLLPHPHAGDSLHQEEPEKHKKKTQKTLQGWECGSL